jgi:hypothetical protein
MEVCFSLLIWTAFPKTARPSRLSPRRRHQEDDAVGEIDLDGDLGVIRPSRPELFVKAIEDPITLLQTEKLGLDIGFQRGGRAGSPVLAGYGQDDEDHTHQKMAAVGAITIH